MIPGETVVAEWIVGWYRVDILLNAGRDMTVDSATSAENFAFQVPGVYIKHKGALLSAPGPESTLL